MAVGLLMQVFIFFVALLFLASLIGSILLIVDSQNLYIIPKVKLVFGCITLGTIFFTALFLGVIFKVSSFMKSLLKGGEDAKLTERMFKEQGILDRFKNFLTTSQGDQTTNRTEVVPSTKKPESANSQETYDFS